MKFEITFFDGKCFFSLFLFRLSLLLFIGSVVKLQQLKDATHCLLYMWWQKKKTETTTTEQTAKILHGGNIEGNERTVVRYREYMVCPELKQNLLEKMKWNTVVDKGEQYGRQLRVYYKPGAIGTISQPLED